MQRYIYTVDGLEALKSLARCRYEACRYNINRNAGVRLPRHQELLILCRQAQHKNLALLANKYKLPTHLLYIPLLEMLSQHFTQGQLLEDKKVDKCRTLFFGRVSTASQSSFLFFKKTQVGTYVIM